MFKQRVRGAWLFLILLGSSCATQRAYVSGDILGTVPAYEKSQPFFIYGLGQSQEINVKGICGKRGVDRIDTTQTFVDGLLAVITIGLYTPRTIQVYCKQPGQ